MVNFCVLIDEDAQEFLDKLPKKSNETAKNLLRILESDPFPGKSGDKELLRYSKHEDLYRLELSNRRIRSMCGLRKNRGIKL